MTERVRIGLLGAGAIAQLAHLPVLGKMRGVELVGLCDSDAAKARALADRFSVPDVFTDIDDLLELEALDAVVVATPNHLHEPHVLSVLARKLPVLCERPLALSARGVERILAAAARVDRVVAVANNHRFRSDVQALERFLQGGELGRVRRYSRRRVSHGATRRLAGAAGGVRRRRVSGPWPAAARPRDVAGRFPGAPARIGTHGSRARGKRRRGQHARAPRVCAQLELRVRHFVVVRWRAGSLVVRSARGRGGAPGWRHSAS